MLPGLMPGLLFRVATPQSQRRWSMAEPFLRPTLECGGALLRRFGFSVFGDRQKNKREKLKCAGVICTPYLFFLFLDIQKKKKDKK
jgi:hypothetical protein